MNKTRRVKISSLPSIIAKDNIPLPTVETELYVWATSPRPGPRLFKQAPIAIGACLNNLGPGLGEVAQTYNSVSTVGKGILSFAMILGRLEIFTLLVLFTPIFWQK